MVVGWSEIGAGGRAVLCLKVFSLDGIRAQDGDLDEVEVVLFISWDKMGESNAV